MKKVIHQAAFLMLVSIVLCIMPYRADANEKEPMTLFLERVYVDGVVSQEMIKSPSMTKKQLMKKYKNWRLLKETDQELVFRTSIDDISPILKDNGYVGLSVNGILSAFEGKPASSQHIIQSFFQIDIKRLESYQHEQLKKGIRVQSKDEYLSLINFYKIYQLQQRPLSIKQPFFSMVK